MFRPFLAAGILFLMACQQKNPQEELILGVWRVDSLYNSYKDRDTLVKPSNSPRSVIGAPDNPKYIEFKEQHIALGYTEQEPQKQDRLAYSVKQDTIIFDMNGQVSYMKIDVLNDTQLTLSNRTPTGGSLYVNIFYYSKKQ